MSDAEMDEPLSGGDEPAERSALQQVELDEALAWHVPWRIRALFIALTVALLLGALAPIWLLRRDTSPVGESPLGVPVQVMSNVATGTVYLDGSKVGSQLPILLTLAPGTHTIRLDAPPFRQQTCRVTAPRGASADTCHGLERGNPLDDAYRLYRVAQHQLVETAVISFPLAIGDLPANEWTRVQAAIAGELSARLGMLRTSVGAGEYYAGELYGAGSLVIRRATESLIAHPIAALSPLAGVESCGAAACPLVGASILADAPAETHELGWTVWTGVTLGWRFTTLAGVAAGSVLLSTRLIRPTISATLTYTRAHSWHLSQAAYAAQAALIESQVAIGLCSDGESLFLSEEPLVTAFLQNGYASLAGCAFRVTVAIPRGGAPTTSGTVIWRYGALLAGDVAIHTALPSLALASTQERASVGLG
jgi:hypothetical protein